MADSIFVAAAPATTWLLDMAGLASQLRTRWPEVHTSTWHSPATDENYLAFELDLDGECRHGAYFDHRYLLLEDGTPKFLGRDDHLVSVTSSRRCPGGVHDRSCARADSYAAARWR